MGWPGWNHIVSVESEGERKRIRRLAYGKCLLEEISLRQPSVMSFLLRPRQLANGTGENLYLTVQIISVLLDRRSVLKKPGACRRYRPGKGRDCNWRRKRTWRERKF